MSKLTLLLAFHNHQPDGNFDHVFQQGYDDCYRPLLDAIADHPRVRCALHHTGPLLEWLDRERPKYLDDLRALVKRGQVEVLGGAFYEPMLAVLPTPDAAGQLAMMNQFCEERLGQKPRGMWLAERVWEPALAETISRAGLQYTLLDDTHFRYAGHAGDLDGYYVTERAGWPLGLFPIEKELRYSIPFQPVDQAIGTLHKLLDRANGRDVVCTYGDDGEKFGMWPGTKEWVWEKGWLRGYFARLSNEERIVTSTFADVVDRTPPSGRIYLPTASYEEMGEWALPAGTQVEYERVKHRLTDENRFEEIRPFFRGGVWQSFFSKYPESNSMHKKMVYVSRKLEAAEALGHRLDDAKRALYRGQCNCAYWHGLFGGLYLNYLRHAVYTNLIAAENAADAALGRQGERAERVDFDGDLRDEVVLSNERLWVGIKPDAGGAFFELDARPQKFNLANVLGRHAEGYHQKLREALRAQQQGHQNQGAPKSIHDLAVVKDAGLEELLHYDRNPRYGLIDHFLAQGTTLDAFSRAQYDDRGDFAGAAYEVTHVTPGVGREASVELRREGWVRDDAGHGRKVRVSKAYTLQGGKLVCRWQIAQADQTPGRVAVLFAPELSLTLLAGDDPGRRYELPSGRVEDQRLVSRGVLEGEHELRLVDDWSRLTIAITGGPKAPTFWRFPLETASQSESGFERTYQGSVIALTWPLELAAGETFETQVAINIEERPSA